MKKILILIFIILLLISIFKFFNFTSLFFASQKFEEYYKVIRVIDGDTFELENGEKVRLLGINAPEKGQKCYFEAKKRLEELVLNKIVKLEGNKKDRYGRLLRYVWINSTLVNLQLIKEGLAISYFFEEDNYTKIFEDAEKYARINSIGCLWQKSEANCKECIGIKIFRWDAPGNDCENPNGEYVIFSNFCDVDCNLTNWKVLDKSNLQFTFPNFILNAKSDVTLYSGCRNEKNNFY